MRIEIARRLGINPGDDRKCVGRWRQVRCSGSYDFKMRFPPPSFNSAHSIQVNIHTDTLNESGFVESQLSPVPSTSRANGFLGTIAAFGGRTIHTYHTEGAGERGS